MKRLIALALLVLFCRVASAEKKKPNPADFPLIAHTISSGRTQVGLFSYFVLDVTIDGREMELVSNSARVDELLPVMDYRVS